MLSFINKYILGISVPILLISLGIFYIFYLRFFHIRHPLKLIKALTKKNPSSGISPFRAVTLALAGTLGVGNIVGVASAITFGGFGSVFWMWVSAFCAMLLKYAEIVLAMRHRRFDEQNKPYGGAMYYIEDFFSSISLKKAGKFFASLFALLCMLNALSMGSMIQSNAISESVEGIFSISPIICGTMLALLSALIIFRGSEVMAKFTEILVPLMTLGYVVISVAVLILRHDMIPSAFASILKDAFTPEAAGGGILGFFISRSLRYGAMRGLISNEAGCGTAPAAHAVSNTKSPTEQGFWGIFEVFADTIVLCSMTALVIIVNFGELRYRGSMILLTIDAYSSVLGDAAGVFLTISVICFGFATIVCWGHYGIQSLKYLTKKKAYEYIFIAAYCFSAFLGALSASSIIWEIADFAIGTMTVINLSVLFFMKKEIKNETELYFTRK